MMLTARAAAAARARVEAVNFFTPVNSAAGGPLRAARWPTAGGASRYLALPDAAFDSFRLALRFGVAVTLFGPLLVGIILSQVCFPFVPSRGQWRQRSPPCL